MLFLQALQRPAQDISYPPPGLASSLVETGRCFDGTAKSIQSARQPPLIVGLARLNTQAVSFPASIPSSTAIKPVRYRSKSRETCVEPDRGDAEQNTPPAHSSSPEQSAQTSPMAPAQPISPAPCWVSRLSPRDHRARGGILRCKFVADRRRHQRYPGLLLLAEPTAPNAEHTCDCQSKGA